MGKFTTKHYVEIAKLLREIDQPGADIPTLVLIQRFAKFFEADNPKFDPGKFYRACTGKEMSNGRGV